MKINKKSYCPNCNSYQLSKDINYLGDEKYNCPNCNKKSETWTVTATFQVFAGDMSKEEVLQIAQNILESMTDGSDFLGATAIDAIRDEQ